MSEGYNGYRNWATYTISVWLNNQEDEHTKWTERANELLEDKEYDKSEAASELSSELESDWEEKLGESGYDEGPLFDFMQNELNQVDWIEVANGFLDDIDVYVAMWNLPGCLPEMEPMKFGDFESASTAIHDALVDKADETGDDPDDDTELGNLVDEVLDKTEPFTVHYAGYAYSVTKE